MSRPIATAVINLDAGTADFILKMRQAGATVKDFGDKGEASVNRVKAALHGVVPEQAAASAAVRALEGNPGIRAAERFLTTTLGLRGALTAAFPLIGAYAFAEILVTMADRAEKFFNEIKFGAAAARAAFGDLASSTRLVNDSLDVSNAKLENEIAKLTGKPENGLKVALLEAKEAADKLGVSLQKDLKDLFQLLDEQNVGAFKAFFTGQSSTTDIKESVGGPTGVTGVIGKVRDLQFQSERDVEGAKTQAEANEIRKNFRDKAAKLIVDEKNLLLDQLSKAKEIDEIEKKLNAIQDPEKRAQERGRQGRSAPGVGSDPTRRIAELEGTISALRQTQRGLNSRFLEGSDKQDLAVAKANQANSDLQKPYDKAIATLKGKLAELNTLIDSAGKSESEKIIARGLAEAAKEAEKLNQELKKQGGLTTAQRKELDTKEVLIAQAQAREKLLTQADEEVKKNRESVASQLLIASTIGKTYEAAKQAAVEIELLKKFGESIKSTNPSDIAAQARLRNSAGAAFDAEHLTQSQNAIFLLKQQADTQEALTVAVEKGAGAVRLQAEIEKEADLVRTQGILGLVAASAARRAFIATEKRESADRTQSLKQEAADLAELSAAYGKGADAIKDAQLKIQQSAIARNAATGVDPRGEQQAAADRDRVARQAEVTKTAGQAVTHYQDQLDALIKERTAIEALAVTDKNRIGIAIALKQNYDEQNRLIREQVLAVGSTKDGARQFLRDLVTENESAASKIYSVFHNAYEGISDQLSRLLTNQKTSFGSFFQGLGQQLVKQQIQQIGKLILTGGNLDGALGDVIKGQIGKGGALGTGVGTGTRGILGIKRDGNTPATALYVTIADPTAATTTSGGSKPDSGLGKLIRIVLGGGPISAPSVTPDLHIPDSSRLYNSSFSIPRLNATPQVTNVYHIDARGSDNPAAVERRTIAAIDARAQQSVSSSVQATLEYSKRNPQ